MKIYLLTYLIEASICLMAFYLFYRLLLQKETSFMLNRVFILVAIVLSIIIPFIEIPVGHDAVYMHYHAAITDISALADEDYTLAFVKKATTTETTSIEVNILFYLYITVCIVLLIRLLFQITSLLYFYYRNKSIKTQKYRLINTHGKLPTFSFFCLLFWDNSQPLSQESKNFILQHELIHIRQWHSLDILLLELLRIIFWFNPAIYLIKKSLQEVHEYLADAAVTTHQNVEAYVQLMVNQLFTNLKLTFTSFFNQSHLKQELI